jgi:hypothetical protein
MVNDELLLLDSCWPQMVAVGQIHVLARYGVGDSGSFSRGSDEPLTLDFASNEEMPIRSTSANEQSTSVVRCILSCQDATT